MKKIGIVTGKDLKKVKNYCKALEVSGGYPVPLNSAQELDRLEEVEGVILPGGADIDPCRYGEENMDSRGVDEVRDELEFEVLCRAVRQKKKVLGICRGHQVINVYFGGSLFQNLPHCEIHERLGTTDLLHGSQVVTESFLYQIYQSDYMVVNSAHHQAVRVLGEGLIAAQYSEDGLVEAFFHRNLPIYGVQWHPERAMLSYAREGLADGQKLFKFFVSQ